MQIQCPKCKQWTDPENGVCTACGAMLDTGESGSHDNEYHAPKLDDLTKRDVSNIKTRKIVTIIVIVLVVGFIGNLIFSVILKSVFEDAVFNAAENTAAEQPPKPKSPYDEFPENILELPNGLDTDQLAEQTLEFYKKRLDAWHQEAEDAHIDSQWMFNGDCSVKTNSKARIIAELRLGRKHVGYGFEYMFSIWRTKYQLKNYIYRLSRIPNAKVYAGVDDNEPFSTTMSDMNSFRGEALYNAMKTGKYLHVAFPGTVESHTSSARINIAFLTFTLENFNDVCALDPKPQESQ